MQLSVLPVPGARARASVPRTSHSLHIHRAATLQAPRHAGAPRWRAASVGGDAVGSWLDLAGFVAKSGSARTPYDDLAAKIGQDCYIDVAGWHLYLKDVKVQPGGSVTLAQALAAQLGAQVDGQGFRAAEVEALVARVAIRLGQGKATLALAEVMPGPCLRDLADIVEDYSRRR